MQLDLFSDVPAAATETRSDEGTRGATVLAFPSARNVANVASIAQRLAPLSADEREAEWRKLSRVMLRFRQAEGLSAEQARKDVIGFRDAIRLLVYRIQGQATCERVNGEQT